MNVVVAPRSDSVERPRAAQVGRWRGHSRHHHTRTAGQALVELAIVLPVFLLLVLAALDLGRIFFAQITVANSAREGAYEAAYGGTYSAGGACSTSNTVMCAVLNEAQGSLTIAPTDVEWQCTGSGGCVSGAYGDAVTVKVTGHFDLITPILGVFFGGTNITFSSEASADVVDTTSARLGIPTPEPSPVPTESPEPTEVVPTPEPTLPTCSPPVAGFTYVQQNRNRPVEFTSTSAPTTGDCQITFWRWEYGDGDTDAGAVPTVTHDYGCRGCTFPVTLTVTNPNGPVSVTVIVTTRS
jgi:TadE-like protein/PKD domain